MAKKRKGDEPEYIEGFGWEADITEDNTTPSTWAFLNRPDSEYKLTYDEWLAKHPEHPKD